MIPKLLSFFKKKKTSGFIIIPATQHNINKKRVDYSALEIVEKLERAGFSAFIVGGAVRDLILGAHPKDFDIATNATPEQVKRLFRRAFIIGRRFQIVHVHLGRQMVEVTTFRGAKKHGEEHTDTHGRILSDNTFGSQLEDANRRDFTINALYYNPFSNKVWDAHDGFADIQKQKLKIIGNIEERFREDPVRILRILRFQAKTGFTINKPIQKAIKKLQNLLSIVPSARLADEFGKYLLGGYSQKGIANLHKWSLLDRFIIKAPNLNKSKISSLPEMTSIALSKADERFAHNKRLSQPFIIAVMLWHNVANEFAKYIQEIGNQNAALHTAMDDIIHLQIKKVFLTRASCQEMRDIWLIQQNLLYPKLRSINRLLKSRRLTAGIDFLEIRAMLKNSDDEQNPSLDQCSQSPNFMNENPQECDYWAKWWRKYLDTNTQTREQMFDDWQAVLTQAKATPAKNNWKKRRRKKKPKVNVEN